MSLSPDPAAAPKAVPQAPADAARPDRAAVFFASDGYDPAARGINGRRVAGESFLRGYLDQMGSGPITGCVETPQAGRAFRQFVARHDGSRETRVVLNHSPRMDGIGTLFYPSPNIGDLAWQRMVRGQAAWSICGITHTTATRSVMQMIAGIVHAPVEPWDALISTSQAVRASVNAQLELAEEYARHRFGGTLPPRPLLPVIPLGVHTAEFAPDPARGAALRQRLGVVPGDTVAMTLSRLSYAEKFDPLPVFVALQSAADDINGRLHYVLVGRFGSDVTAEHYRQAAARLMPDVALHILDGTSRDERMAALSGSDMFLFPIDNVQETFGLAPVEAMAAGLPVIATDWDGLRDTVTPDCGVLIPTLTGRAAHGRIEALRYLTGTDSYHAFLSLTASMTSYDPQTLAQAVAGLAANPARRAQMGAAGQARARHVFDWAAVMGQMRALWIEQDSRRRSALPSAPRVPVDDVPVLPSPFTTFAAWPTAQLGSAVRFARAASADSLPPPSAMVVLRGLDRLKRMTEPPERLEQVLAALNAGPQDAITIAAALAMPVVSVERAALFLLKYGYIAQI